MPPLLEHWLISAQISVQDFDLDLGVDIAPPHIQLHEVFLLCLFAFLAGSVPFGLWISRSFGVDIRQHGSGNIGATNVARVLGTRLGVLCFVLDMLKGFVPTLYAGLHLDLVPGLFFAQPINPPHWAWLWLVIMALPILGHMYSPWVGFKGGKGVATGLGALLGVFPYLAVPAVSALAVWGIIAALSRYVSLASVAAVIALPLLVVAWAWISVAATTERARIIEALVQQGPGLIPFYIVTTVMAIVVIWKHRANVRRLLTGKERRIGERVQARNTSPST